MKYLPFIFAFFSIVITSCQKESAATTENETVVVQPAGSYNVNATSMLQLVNNVRKSGCNCGATPMPPVPALTWNDLLAQAAYAHSVDMQSKNYFDHTGLDGSNPGMRIKAAGYSWRAYGENIAKGYSSESEVVDGWIKSEGHCKNIMSANVKEMGAGRAGVYWTQEFGSR